MLTELRLTRLGVITEATLSLGPGLTVLTGETGAGKTMVLTALALLLGARAEPALVRGGSERAHVEGRWLLPPDHPALARATEAGAELDDDGTLLVHRSVGRDGRSRATLGGTSVPAGVLGALAEPLVAVHGQADQLRLTRAAQQRRVLDAFGGPPLAAALAGYAVAYREHATLSAELAELSARARERAQEAEALRSGLERVGALDPQPGEEEELAERIARLSHLDALAAATAEARAGLAGSADDPGQQTDALGLLAGATHALAGVAAHDPELAAIADRLGTAGSELADVASELAAYGAGLAADPAELDALAERRAALSALTRLYAPDAAGLVAWAGQAAARLAEVDGDDDRRAALGHRLEAATAGLAAAAAVLHDERRRAGDLLAERAGSELAGLAMAGAVLRVELIPTEPAAHGADEVTITLAPHPGSPARPLGRGASGGELSRVMLALEVALAGTDDIPTLVFDEVDAGVGGAAALQVGARLARLAVGRQVLVVTHLAQVAAFADRHVRVAVRGDGGGVAASDVVTLDDSDGPHGRVVELARMLGGQQDSGAARDHARELLATAAEATRAPARRASAGRRRTGASATGAGGR